MKIDNSQLWCTAIETEKHHSVSVKIGHALMFVMPKLMEKGLDHTFDVINVFLTSDS